MSQCPIEPFGSRIVVRPHKQEKKTEGGIVLPDLYRQDYASGEVIATGRGTFHSKIGVVPPEAKVGDHVIYDFVVGKQNQFTYDGFVHVMLSEHDIVGRIQVKKSPAEEPVAAE